MTDDIYEPLTEYSRVFKDLHAQNTSEMFESLVAQSGVDESANAALVAEIRGLEAKLADSEGRRSRIATFNVLSIVVAVIAAIAAIVLLFVPEAREAIEGSLAIPLALLGGATLFGMLSGKKLLPSLRALDSLIASLRSDRDLKVKEATEQMAPLNGLFDWGMPAQLVHKTSPRIEMDPTFSVGRLRELQSVFSLDDSFNQGTSVLGVQSGEINGNPFVFADTLGFEWTPHVYSGSITIHWTETIRGADGKRQVVHRSQVLTATATHPVPEFGDTKFVIYGNLAAPDLVFSREPSSLSGEGDGFFSRARRRRELKSLKKKAAAIENGKVSDFTLMSNHDFEVLFHAIDRSDEIQFRLLFTPLAQQQMVKLLNDTKIGFGDDFSFQKIRMINCITPRHLQSVSLDTRPDRYASYDLAAVRRSFNDFNNDYFKHLYFALAPLLAIPLYQQTRTHESIWGDAISRSPSFWEHESLANYHGDGSFAHPDSVTRNILKTKLSSQSDSEQEIAVTAHGFRGEPRVDTVRVFGGDGRWHNVPVEWTEYLPVARTSGMKVLDSGGKSLQEYNAEVTASERIRETFARWNPGGREVFFRRTLLSYRP